MPEGYNWTRSGCMAFRRLIHVTTVLQVDHGASIAPTVFTSMPDVWRLFVWIVLVSWKQDRTHWQRGREATLKSLYLSATRPFISASDSRSKSRLGPDISDPSHGAVARKLLPSTTPASYLLPKVFFIKWRTIYRHGWLRIRKETFSWCSVWWRWLAWPVHWRQWEQEWITFIFDNVFLGVCLHEMHEWLPRVPPDVLGLPVGSLLGVALGTSPLRSIPNDGYSMG